MEMPRNFLTVRALAGMPRYHFHLVNGVEVFDSLGVMLGSDAAARIHAESLAADFAGPKTYLKITGIRVTNELGLFLFRLQVHR